MMQNTPLLSPRVLFLMHISRIVAGVVGYPSLSGFAEVILKTFKMIFVMRALGVWFPLGKAAPP